MRARAGREFPNLDPAQLRRVRLFAEQLICELESLAKSAAGEKHLDAREAVEAAKAVRDLVVRM